jgi:hypothetical protein
MTKILLYIALLLPGLVLAEKESLGEGIYITRNMQSNAEKKIAIATVIISGDAQEKNESYLGTTYGELVSFATKSKELYAKRYGYDYIVATEKLDTCYGNEQKRPLECAWTKLALISRILQNYDWVFWTDADSVILNFDTKLEEFLDEKYDIIAASENVECTTVAPFNKYFLNTGEVFYKNSDFSAYVIKEAWNDHEEVTPRCYEQMRINRLIRSLSKEKKQQVLVYPASPFNVHPDKYHDGDFLMHLFAFHGKRLYQRMHEVEEKYGYIIDAEEQRQNEQG